MSELSQIKEIVLGHAKQSAKEIILSVAYPALEKVVKESSTPIDDLVLAAMGEKLKEELLKLIEQI